MDYISQINVDNTVYSVGFPNIYINSKGNFNIETSAEIGNTSKGKINIESMDDIQIKPGDDIVLYSHHRAEDKQDEVAVKVTDGDDIPVKLQLNAAELVLTTKDKTGNNANVMDVTVNAAQNTRGYLKVRAQAIDLRSETHGGIALQPKGFDSDSHMNKIKFEHGGGDGLEFGTFNTEKTSIFTDEYRFNKDGVWKMATRVTEASDKADSGDATTALKYVKQDDDFYDVISKDDVTATTKDIIKTANALNGTKGIHTKITSKNNLEIATSEVFTVTEVITDTATLNTYLPGEATCVIWPNTSVATDVSNKFENLQVGDTVSKEDILACGQMAYNTDVTEAALYDYMTHSGNDTLEIAIGIYQETEPEENEEWSIEKMYTFSYTPAPDVNIESAGDIKIDSAGELKLKGILDFGSTFNFGETDEGIEVQYKLTKKNAEKDCGVLRVVGVNNHASNNLVVEGVTIAPGETETIDECSILDIIKLTNYMKDNGLGPWSVNNG